MCISKWYWWCSNWVLEPWKSLKAKDRVLTMETLTNEYHNSQSVDYSDDSIESINIFEYFGLGSHERLLELEFSSQLIDSKHIVPMGLG